MISPQDIAAFQEENADVIAAAEEFRRRSRKLKGKVGPQPDRWASTDGLKQVAEGIGAMMKIMNAQRVTLLALARIVQQDDQRSADAMGLHTQDSKYAQKQEQ